MSQIGKRSSKLRVQDLRNLDEIYKEYVRGNYEAVILEEVLSAAKRRSQSLEVRQHPLGFYHAELTPFVDAPSGERFRLHFWLDESGATDELGDLHEHTWDLCSLVLAGCVIDSNLVATSAPDGAFVGSRITYGEGNTSVRIGRFELETVLKRRIDVGSVYEIPSRTVHLNAVETIPTVTLVRSVQDDRGDGPLVFNRADAEVGQATALRPRVTATIAFERLESALVSVL